MTSEKLKALSGYIGKAAAQIDTIFANMEDLIGSLGKIAGHVDALGDQVDKVSISLAEAAKAAKDRKAAPAPPENLSAAAAASPLSGETRGEAAGWISVEDRPPEKDEVVIICGKYICSGEIIYPEILITDIDEFVHSGYVPIAWMPLPEPPEVEA
jgi:hypothetical protein